MFKCLLIFSIAMLVNCTPRKRESPVTTSTQKSPSSGNTTQQQLPNNTNNGSQSPNYYQPIPAQPAPQQNTQSCLAEFQTQGITQDQIFYKAQTATPGLYRVALQQPANSQQSFLMQNLQSNSCTNLNAQYR